MLKNFEFFAWALKDYCIQEGFKVQRIKFERRKVLYKCFIDKCPFKVYAALQKFGQCFHIRFLHNIHTSESFVKNLEVTID